MPEDPDLDQPEDAPVDDDVVGIGEDEDEFDEEEQDVDDEETFDGGPRELAPTDEVGSEGGSEGASLGRTHSRIGRTGGSESTETWLPSDRDRRTIDYRDSGGVPVRRSPS
jgi:hypothetical protein